jgi:hypothetical protein
MKERPFSHLTLSVEYNDRFSLTKQWLKAPLRHSKIKLDEANLPTIG